MCNSYRLVLAGWVNREQQDVIDYLREENGVLEPGFGASVASSLRTTVQARRCFRHQVLLGGCGQWQDVGRERVARLREQEYLDPRPQWNRRRRENVWCFRNQVLVAAA